MDPIRWDVLIGDLAIARTELSQVAPEIYPLAVPRLAADDAALDAAEARVGHPLDPQLRAFLGHVDGWPAALLDGDILGAQDLGQGPVWERAVSVLDMYYEMSPTDGLPARDQVLPIFVSAYQNDVMVVRLDGPTSNEGHEVLWLVNEVVDRWPNIHEWLLAAVQLVTITTNHMRRREA